MTNKEIFLKIIERIKDSQAFETAEMDEGIEYKQTRKIPFDTEYSLICRAYNPPIFTHSYVEVIIKDSLFYNTRSFYLDELEDLICEYESYFPDTLENITEASLNLKKIKDRIMELGHVVDKFGDNDYYYYFVDNDHWLVADRTENYIEYEYMTKKRKEKSERFDWTDFDEFYDKCHGKFPEIFEVLDD